MILLFPHAATKNHGCEAIIQSMSDILERQGVNKDDIDLLHKDIEHDDVSTIRNHCNVLDFKMPVLKRGTLPWFVNYIDNKVHGCKYMAVLKKFDQFMVRRETPKVMVSIGGDNYCYGKPYSLYAFDKWANEHKVKLVLWGCSIEETKDEEMLEDLRRFDLIIARESLTYDFLNKISGTRTLLLPDPAFTLKPEEVSENIVKVSRDTVGINISPMIMEYEKNENMAFRNYVNLVEHIINHTQFDVLLIPHVTVDTTDDRKPLRELYNRFSGSGRVQMVGDMNCSELKFLISKCRFFIGARTHSTIAAYSSCVPTLVVGYSVKARGIAKDLFGTTENYVLPVQQLKAEDELVSAFQWLCAHERQVRDRLETIMPEYIARAYQAGEEIRRLID